MTDAEVATKTAMRTGMGVLLRVAVYSWLYVIAIWMRVITPRDPLENGFIFVSATLVLTISVLLATTKFDVVLVKLVRGNAWLFLLTRLMVVAIWLGILYAWYSGIDGRRDIEESFLYYEPLVFLLSLPGSVILMLIETVWTSIFGHGLLGAVEPVTTTDIKVRVIGIWAECFLVFLLQAVIVGRWLNKLDNKQA